MSAPLWGEPTGKPYELEVEQGDVIRFRVLGATQWHTGIVEVNDRQEFEILVSTPNVSTLIRLNQLRYRVEIV